MADRNLTSDRHPTDWDSLTLDEISARIEELAAQIRRDCASSIAASRRCCAITLEEGDATS